MVSLEEPISVTIGSSCGLCNVDASNQSGAQQQSYADGLKPGPSRSRSPSATNICTPYFNSIKGTAFQQSTHNVHHEGPYKDIFDVFDPKVNQPINDENPLPSIMSVVEGESKENTTGPSVMFSSTNVNANEKENELLEQLILAGQSESYEEVVNALANVEGYDTESWGAAVDITDTSCPFYPTKLTCALEPAEFLKFMEESSDSEESPGNPSMDSGNDTLAVPSSPVNPVTTGKHTEMEGEDMYVDVEGSFEDELLNMNNGAENVEMAAQDYVDPYLVPTDPRRPPAVREYSEYLDKDINEIPDDVITADFVLHFVLKDVNDEGDFQLGQTQNLVNEPVGDALALESSTAATNDGSEKTVIETDTRSTEVCTLNGNYEDKHEEAENEEKFKEPEPTVSRNAEVKEHEEIIKEPESTVSRNAEVKEHEEIIREPESAVSKNAEVKDHEEIFKDLVSAASIKQEVKENEENTVEPVTETLEDHKVTAAEEITVEPVTEALEGHKVTEAEEITVEPVTEALEDHKVTEAEENTVEVVSRSEDLELIEAENIEKLEPKASENHTIEKMEKSRKNFKGEEEKVASDPSDIDVQSVSSLHDDQELPNAPSNCMRRSGSHLSVASSSSSHSSIRPCSVILTRLNSRMVNLPIAHNVGEVKEPESDKVSITDNEILQTPATSVSNDCVVESGKGSNKGKDDLPLPTAQENVAPRSRKFAKSPAKLMKQTTRVVSAVASSEDNDNVPMEHGVNINEMAKSQPTVEKVKASEISPQPEAASTTDEPGTSRHSTNSTKSVGKRGSRGIDSEIEVVSKKQKIQQPPKKAVKPVADMTFKETLAFIKAESSKLEPDYVRLSEAMTKTYENHRKPTYEKIDVTIPKIMKFPGLRHYKMAKEEYGRIREDITKMEDLERELVDVFQKALEPKVKRKKIAGPKKEKEKHPIWKQAIRLWEEKQPDPNYLRILGILSVCFEFAEDNVVNVLCRILKEGESLTKAEIKTITTPKIVVKESDIFKADEDSDIWIYVDGTKFLKVPNIYEGILSAFASYYICNIAYPPELKTLLEFFDMLNGNSQSTFMKPSRSQEMWPPTKINGKAFFLG